MAAGLLLGALGEPLPARGDPQPSTTPIVEFAQAPEGWLQLPDLDGRLHDLAAYRGEVVVVNFWATWCAPCVAEMAAFERAHRGLWPHGTRLLAINAGDPDDSVRRFVERTAVTFPVLLDRSLAATRAWQVGAFPTTYVVGRDGRVIAGALGAREWDSPEIASALARLGGHPD
jgi:peroxiredoxin